MSIRGESLPVGEPPLPEITLGGVTARIVRASRTRFDFVVPGEVAGGPQPLRMAGVPSRRLRLDVGVAVATGLHQVDRPAIGPDGSLYVTHSGSRDERAPVSIYRVSEDGGMDPFSNVPNPTSLAVAPDGRLFVSSRFEGVVYRLDAAGSPVVFASGLGVPFGLVFDGPTLLVGDRTGTIHKVDEAGRAVPFASLPPSVAACHLARGPDGDLYATAPTLGPHDQVYRIESTGRVTEAYGGFGRPQGLAFDGHGRLHVTEALAGAGAIHRFTEDGRREVVVTGRHLVGVVFDATDRLLVASSDTVYRFDGEEAERGPVRAG